MQFKNNSCQVHAPKVSAMITAVVLLMAHNAFRLQRSDFFVYVQDVQS